MSISNSSGDILKIGICRTHAPCCRTKRIITRMNISCLIDIGDKSPDICPIKLCKRTILEDKSCNLMRLSNLLEDFIIDRISRFIFLDWLDSELFKKKNLYLFWRIDIQCFPCQKIYPTFKTLHITEDILSHLLKLGLVHTYATMLHMSKYRYECWLHRIYRRIFSCFLCIFLHQSSEIKNPIFWCIGDILCEYLVNQSRKIVFSLPVRESWEKCVIYKHELIIRKAWKTQIKWKWKLIQYILHVCQWIFIGKR